jgi:hypothetical protein
MRHSMLLTLCAALGGCAIEIPCDLEVNVHPDGSGVLQYVRATVRADPLFESAVMKGVSAPDGYAATAYRAVFANANELKIGDIEVQFAENEGGFRLALTIPTTAESQWYRALGLDPVQLEAWSQVAAREQSFDPDNKERLRRLESCTFRIDMPGNIVTSRLIGTDVPAGWRLVENADLFGGPTPDSDWSTLQIPFRDLRLGKVKSVTWEITCGAFEEDDRSEWEETRRRLEAAKRPR